MSPEIKGKITNVVRIGAVGCVLWGGNVGFIEPGNTELGKECTRLSLQITNMQQALFAKTTPISPEDSNTLQNLRSLRDEKDVVCARHAKEDNWWALLGRTTAAVGLTGLLLTLLPKKKESSVS